MKPCSSIVITMLVREKAADHDMALPLTLTSPDLEGT
ncbi:hypothetical protein AAY473_010991 [Plecturocebus cupreus]